MEVTIYASGSKSEQGKADGWCMHGSDLFEIRGGEWCSLKSMLRLLIELLGRS